VASITCTATSRPDLPAFVVSLDVRVANGEVHETGEFVPISTNAVIKLFKQFWKWLDDRLGISVLLAPAMHIAPQMRNGGTFRQRTLVAFIVQGAKRRLRWRFIYPLVVAILTRRFILTMNAPFGHFRADFITTARLRWS